MKEKKHWWELWIETLIHLIFYHWNKRLKCDTLTSQSIIVMKNLHHCTQRTEILEQVLSEGDARPWSRFQDVAPDVLHSICHTPIFPSCSPAGCEALYLFILFIRYSGDESQQQSFHMRSNDTQTQNWQTHWLQHKPPPHPTPSSFLGNVLQFQIRLSHQFLPVKGKKEGRKAMKMMISLSWSLGLSHTIYFDIPPHQLLYLTILCTEST